MYRKKREAEAVAEAVSPDNVKAPKGLIIETIRVERNVVTTIKYEEDKLGTFISTIDDFLSCVSVAEKAFSAVERQN